MKHRIIPAILLAAVLMVCTPVTLPVYAETASYTEETKDGFKYEHDPMENPDAAKDIVVNPDAVYGYSPSPDSTRLKDYVDAIDWTDPDQVEEAKQERIAYHQSLKELYQMIEDLLAEGKDTEAIARAVSARRNEIRLEANKTEEELELVKRSNLETYGNENGPTPEFLYEKYGSWEKVLEKALSPNAGMDACLGLYDDMYDTYVIAKQAEEAGSNVPSTGVGDPGTYTVKPGDSLWKIAGTLYRDSSKWADIYRANQDSIVNPSLIFPGQVLALPAL